MRLQVLIIAALLSLIMWVMAFDALAIGYRAAEDDGLLPPPYQHWRL